MIRSTNHTIKFANVKKKQKYHKFIYEYRRAAAVYLDFLWNNKIEFAIKEKQKYFDIKNNQLDVPTYLPKTSLTQLTLETELSARVLKCCLTQVLGVVRAATDVQKRRIFVYNKTPNEFLFAKIQKHKCVKPSIQALNPELNSICIEFSEFAGSKFAGFVEMKSLGFTKKFRLPIKFHRQNKKYKTWKCLNSFLLTDDSINFRWETKVEKQKGSTIGADQGILDILTLSDGQKTQKYINKKTLQQLMVELSRKRKGSAASRRKMIERDNFIRECLNNLTFSGVAKVCLEQVKDLRKGRRVSAVMSHWTYALIENKMRGLSETEGFVLQMNSSAFRSQRCSACDLVLKSNRNKKQFVCACGHAADADFNASCNHAIALPDVPLWLRKSGLNKSPGFYWTPSGFFGLDGVELTVPLSTN